MGEVGRGLLALLVFVAVYFFSFWMVFGQLVPEDALIVAEGLSILAGAACAYFAWHQAGKASNGLLQSILMGALILGSAGFVLGFFGPMLAAPDSGQGPLLGLFITGPGGAVLGAVAGLAWWLFLGRKS